MRVVGGAAQERAGRPGAGDQPGERTAPSACVECVAQAGRQRDRGRFQIVHECGGDGIDVAVGECGDESVRGGRGRRGGARGPQLVERAVRVAGRDPEPGRRENPVQSRGTDEWREQLAPSGAERGPAHEREHGVAADARGHRDELGAGQIPQRRAGEQCPRGVGRTPGHPAGHRNAFRDRQLHVGSDAGVVGKGPGCLPGEIALVGGDAVGTAGGDRDAVRRRGCDVVRQVDGVEQVVQLVVTVRARRPDAQVQVDLGRYSHPDVAGGFRAGHPPDATDDHPCPSAARTAGILVTLPRRGTACVRYP